MKTKVMLFSHPRNPLFAEASLSLHIDNTVIEQVPTFKYLGLHLDNNLTFGEHINTICKRVDQRSGLLWRVRNFIPESFALHLYKSLIHPHFSYCSHLYDGCNLTNQRRLQISQNNALRAVLKAPAQHSTELLHSKTGVEWLDIERAKTTWPETFKCLNELNPPRVNAQIVKYVPIRTTRLGESNAICCPIARTRMGEVNFPWRAHQYWSILPVNLRGITSLNAFKDSIKQFNGFTHVC